MVCSFNDDFMAAVGCCEGVERIVRADSLFSFWPHGGKLVGEDADLPLALLLDAKDL